MACIENARMAMRGMAVALLLATALLAFATACRAQDPDPVLEGVKGHVTLAAANAAVSGLTAGLLRWHRGGSFRDGFVYGAAGGAGVYAGKVVAVRDVPGAGLVGRQVASVGASVVRNAALAAPPLGRLTLPLGPARVHMLSDRSGELRLSVDVAGVVALGAVLLAYDAELDWASSMAAGAPVVMVRDHDVSWYGRHLWGTVLIQDSHAYPRAHNHPLVLAHEVVHLLQYDQFMLLWGEPVEAMVLNGWAPGRGVEKRVHLGIHAVLGGAMYLFLPEHRNPLEIEAHFLADTWGYAGRDTDGRFWLQR